MSWGFDLTIQWMAILSIHRDHMDQQTVTVVVAIVGITGTLVGSFTSQAMARRSQKRQLFADLKRTEYKEVAIALADARMALVRREIGDTDHILAPDQKTAEEEQVSRVLNDRLFIRKELRDALVEAYWEEARAYLLCSEGTISDFDERYDHIHGIIADLATRAILKG
jgi:hypothetical protein